MARHGTIEEFENSREDWLTYTERMQQYLTANDVRRADKQHAILLSSVGASTYQLSKSLLAPEKPGNHSLEEMVKVMQNQFQPPPSESVQHYTFNTHSHKQGGSISIYVAELRRLAEHHNSGKSLNVMLQDCLVWRVNDQRLQRRSRKQTWSSWRPMKLRRQWKLLNKVLENRECTQDIWEERREWGSQRDQMLLVPGKSPCSRV